MSDLRIKIAALARKFYAKEITFSDFLAETPEQDQDDLIDELVDLIEHEPKRGGIFGINDKEHKQYINKIFQLIERLEHETT